MEPLLMKEEEPLTLSAADEVDRPAKRSGRVSATRILRVADKGLLGAFVGAIIAVFILDAIFFMAWAPEWWLVPVFLLIGVTIRMVGVFTGPIMQVVAKDKSVGREAKTIRGLSIAAGIICLIPALSFFAGGHYNQTHSSTVAVATEGVSDTNKDGRIKTLRGQIKRIETDRDASIKETNETITAIVNDGVPGISAADNVSIGDLRKEIQGYRTTATTQIGGLETKIEAIEQEKETVQTTSAVEQARVSPASAIFEVLGSIVGEAGIWAMSILFLFAILIEAIAFFGLGAYQGLHKFFVEAIQRMELDEAAHEARLEVEAQRVKDKIAAEALLERANADLELAAIEAAAHRARVRAEAARAGEDPDLEAPLREAEADRRAAAVEEQAAKIRREAATLRSQANHVPPEVEKPADLSQQQINGKKGADAKKHKATATQAAANDWIPVDDLSERFAQTAEGAGA
jgi:hypothetical protein